MSQAIGKQTAQSSPVVVPGAQANQEISVPAVAGAQVQFQFDPTTASVERIDNNLVLTLDNGGKVTVTDFFVTDGQPLPMLALPDGQVVPSEAVLAGLNGDMDLSTAAGPAARPPSSGGTSYEDGAGNLIGGTDRLGSLGTDFWGNTLGQTEEGIGTIETPSGIFTFDVSSNAGGAFGLSDGLYEDGKAFQHDNNPNNDQVVAGKLNFSFIPDGSTVVDGVSLTGFPVGTTIYIGDPANPTQTITIGLAGQSVDLTFDQLSVSGVYLLPPPNSDADMNINARVTLRATSSNVPQTFESSFTVVVDAVADRPTEVNVSGAADESAHHMDNILEDGKGDTDGYYKSESKDFTNEDQTQGVTLNFQVTATFSDYTDGSEQHFVLVETKAGFAAVYDTVELDGTTYYKVPVSNEDIAKGNGTVTVDVQLESAAPIVKDSTPVFKTGAMAVDTPTDADLTTENNTSFTINETPVSVDVIDSTLTVQVGWASEGNSPDKNLASGSQQPDWVAGDVSGATNSLGAPITIGISGDTDGGSAERITEITFEFDDARGSLWYDGQEYHSGDAIPVAAASGGLYFKPTTDVTEQYNDADVSLEYTVNVSNGSGASATYTGKTTVVIDAVADLAKNLDAEISADNVSTTTADFTIVGGKVTVQEGSQNAPEKDGWETDNYTVAGGTVSYPVVVKVSASFGPDASESRFMYIEQPANGTWSVDEVNVPQGLSYVGTEEGPDGVTYFKFEVTEDIVTGSDGSLKNVSYDVPLKVAVPAGTDLAKTDIRTAAESVEKDADGQYNKGNDTAWAPGKTVDASVDVINATLEVKTGWASEGNAPDKNEARTHTPDWNADSEGDNVSSATNTNGAPIKIDLDADASSRGEHITSITISTLDGDGSFYYNGEKLDPSNLPNGVSFANGAFTITLSGNATTGLGDSLYYQPKEGSTNAKEVTLNYKVTVENEAGASATFSGSSTIVMDAVADLPTNVNTGVAYDGNADNTAGRWGSAIDVKVNATFSDYKDGSENHYLLVEAREGWSCSNATGSVTLEGVKYYYKEVTAEELKGTNGAGAFTFKLTAPTNPGGTLTGDAKIISEDGSITLKSGSLAVEGKIDGTQNGQVVPSGEDREWDLGNNVAFAGKDTTIKFNVINSEDKSEATAAYEDHQSDPAKQGVKDQVLTDDGNITLSLAPANGEHITDVTLTFNFAGTQPGTFTYNGTDYEPKSVDGKWTITLPAAAVQAAGDDTSVTLRYNPPANDDTDLTNLNYSMNVKANTSDATGTHKGDITSDGTSTTGTLIVDAVADPSGKITSEISANGTNQGNKLVEHADAVTVDGNRNNSPATTGQDAGWEKDTFNAQAAYKGQTHTLVVSVKTDFPDTDDSETHTLLVQKPATGTWSVDTDSLPDGYSLVMDSNNKPILYDDGKGNVYFQIKVDASGTPGNNYDGKAEADITLKVSGISGDLNTTIKTGAISQEGAKAPTEIDMNNNTATRTDGSAPNYVIDVINSSLTVRTGWASEGNNDAQHLGTDSKGYAFTGAGSGATSTNADKSNNGAPIQISISGNSGISGTTSEYISSITISHPGVEGNLVYKGIELVPGMSSTVIGGNTVTFADGKFTITFGNNTTTSLNNTNPASVGSDLVYRPNANSDSDTDVNLDYSVTVKNGAGAQATFSGSSTVVVDAVADKPDVTLDADMGKVVDYQIDPTTSKEQTAARPGENVKVNIESVKFGDYKDGSESHFITLNKTLTSTTLGQPNATTSIATGQTITLTGKDAGGGTVTQTVVFGDSAAHSTITITKADGTFTTRTMTGPEYNAMASSADGYSNFKIPVLNDFLKLTNDGTVSTSFDIKAPSSSVNTTYEAKVGGFAKEEATTGGELDKENGNYKGNNESWTAEKVKFDVNPVTSTPKVVINLVDSKVYENDTPHANIPGNTEKGGGANINISGIDAGETATIELTFSLKDGKELAKSVNDGDVMRIEYGGVPYPATYSTADGKWHVTVKVEGADNGDAADGVLTFKPGSNYNSSDIHVDYNITVRDNDSGQAGKMVDGVVVGDDANPWQNHDSTGGSGYQAENKDMGILVDAVAQAPDINDVKPDYTATGGSNAKDAAFVSGKDIALRADITFEDYKDGSEKHYMLVEAKAGWEAPTSIKIFGSDNKWHEITPLNVCEQKLDVNGVKTMYYLLEIPNKMIEDYGTDGKIDAQIWMKSPAGAGDTEFKVGAIANEDANKFNNTTNVDFDKGNNTSIVIKDTPVKIHFDNATGAKLSIGDTYEDLNSKQNTSGGQTHKDNPGSIVFTSKTSGDDEVLTEVTISFKNPEGTVTLPGGITIDSAGDITAPAGYTVDTEASGKTTITKDGSNSSIEITKDANGTTNVTMKPGADTGLNTRLEVNYTPDLNSDADFKFDYSTATKDPSSGDIATTNGSSTVVVDAVADLSKDLDIKGGTINDTAFEMKHGVKIPTDSNNPEYQSIKVTVKADFGSDIKDGSEAHYVLIEVTANTYVTNADGSIMNCDIFYGPGGVRYYKVPVANSEINADGTVDKEITLITYSRQLGVENDNIVTIRTGALAVEEHPNGGELNQNNNTAFLKGESFTITNHWPGGHTIWIDPAYENNTPRANLDDPTKPGTQPDESAPKDGEANGKMYFGSVTEHGPAITQAGLTWNKDAGKIEIRDADGKIVDTYYGPTVTLNIADLKTHGYNAYFVPNHNYSDKDVDIKYTLYDGKNTPIEGTFPIIIDAVAQMPTAVDYVTDEKIDGDIAKYGEWQTKVDYGNSQPDGSGYDYTAMGTTDNSGNEGTVKITVGGGSLDKDGSEQRYALLEDTGEFTIKSPDTAGNIYLYDTTTDDSGKTWIKIPIPQGKTSVDIEIVLKNPTSGEHVIRTGIMTEEQNAGKPGDYEVDAKNNIAYDLSGSTVINVSTVDSSASVAIPSEIKENEGFDLVIKGECSTTDTFNSLTITHTGSGKLTFSGGTDYDGMYTYTGGTLTITNRVLLEALNNGKVKFSFTPNPYDDADVTWNWKSSFTDTLSGDTSGLDESKTTVVDAVAQAPDVDHTSFGSADGTHEAAMRSGEAVIKSTVTFKDLDGSEKHYIVLEQDGDWTCKGVTVNGVTYPASQLTTMFSENGTPYYALKVTNDMLTNGVAEVQFTLNAPDKNSDVGGSLKIGGISVEETTGAGGSGGKETDLANNWSQGLEDAKVGMAIVETDKVDLVATGELKEDDATGVALSLTGVKVQNTNGDQANDEIITKTTFTVDQAGTPAGRVIGKITYNNVDYPVKAGEATTIDFGDTGFDSSKGPRFVLDANNHNNGTVTVKTESTVVDTKSGDSKTFTDTDEITVVATADAPTNIEVTGPSYTPGTTAVGAGKSVTFEVSATFADTDGSEQRFILVEKKDDWGNPKGYGTVTENGTTYYKVPVYRTDGGPVDVTLTTPSNATDDTVNLKVGGMAVENSNPSAPKFTFEDDHVSVNIGVVDTTAVTGSGQGDEDDAAGAAITLTADGKNEAITKVVFTAPTSGEIWYNGAAVTAVNGKITIDNFDTTKLEYHPAANFSGSVDLSYTATVQDKASGASKEFGTSSPLTVTITINPLNDAPEIGDNTRVFDPTDLNLSGQLVFSDVDMAHEGDTLSLWVNGTLVTGEEYTRFEGENGDLSINGKGEYTYTPHEGTSPADLPAGVLDEFGFKVVDSYGVSSAGNLEISLGSDSLHIEDVNGAFKIYGSSHSEEITGSTGNDTVFAFDGDDTIHGGAGHDYIHGGAGDDIIYGGEGDDTIYGGEGNDLIFAGKGDDVLFGGAGADTFSWTVGDHDNGTDTIHGFSAAEGDKLCIGIMAQDGEVLSLHDVLDSGNNDIDVYLEAEVNQTGITLHVNSGDVAQTIVIEMGAGAVAGYDNYQSFVEQFQNTQDEEAQSAMVQHLLSTITC